MTNKWDEVDKRIRGQNSPDRSDQALEPEVLPAISSKGSPLSPQAPEPTTIIARFRTNQIQRRLAIAQLSEYYDAKIELVKHQLKEAVRAKKAEATETADRFLMELNHSQLKFLAELGLKNVDKRQEILIELNERTSRRMADIMTRDWPNALKDQAIDEIMAMNKDFGERLRRELGRSGND